MARIGKALYESQIGEKRIEMEGPADFIARVKRESKTDEELQGRITEAVESFEHAARIAGDANKQGWESRFNSEARNLENARKRLAQAERATKPVPITPPDEAAVKRAETKIVLKNQREMVKEISDEKGGLSGKKSDAVEEDLLARARTAEQAGDLETGLRLRFDYHQYRLAYYNKRADLADSRGAKRTASEFNELKDAQRVYDAAYQDLRKFLTPNALLEKPAPPAPRRVGDKLDPDPSFNPDQAPPPKGKKKGWVSAENKREPFTDYDWKRYYLVWERMNTLSKKIYLAWKVDKNAEVFERAVLRVEHMKWVRRAIDYGEGEINDKFRAIWQDAVRGARSAIYDLQKYVEGNGYKNLDARDSIDNPKLGQSESDHLVSFIEYEDKGKVQYDKARRYLNEEYDLLAPPARLGGPDKGNGKKYDHTDPDSVPEPPLYPGEKRAESEPSVKELPEGEVDANLQALGKKIGLDKLGVELNLLDLSQEENFSSAVFIAPGARSWFFGNGVATGRGMIEFVYAWEDSLQTARGTFRHETQHALNSLFTTPEKAILAPDLPGWRKRYRVEQRWAEYKEQYGDEVAEKLFDNEAVSEAYRELGTIKDRKDAARQGFSGEVARIFERVADWAEGARIKLRKDGYRTSAEILRGIERGDFANRKGNIESPLYFADGQIGAMRFIPNKGGGSALKRAEPSPTPTERAQAASPTLEKTLRSLNARGSGPGIYIRDPVSGSGLVKYFIDAQGTITKEPYSSSIRARDATINSNIPKGEQALEKVNALGAFVFSRDEKLRSDLSGVGVRGMQSFYNGAWREFLMDGVGLRSRDRQTYDFIDASVRKQGLTGRGVRALQAEFARIDSLDRSAVVGEGVSMSGGRVKWRRSGPSWRSRALDIQRPSARTGYLPRQIDEARGAVLIDDRLRDEFGGDSHIYNVLDIFRNRNTIVADTARHGAPIFSLSADGIPSIRARVGVFDGKKTGGALNDVLKPIFEQRKQKAFFEYFQASSAKEIFAHEARVAAKINKARAKNKAAGKKEVDELGEEIPKVRERLFTEDSIKAILAKTSPEDAKFFEERIAMLMKGHFRSMQKMLVASGVYTDAEVAKFPRTKYYYPFYREDHNGIRSNATLQGGTGRLIDPAEALNLDIQAKVGAALRNFGNRSIVRQIGKGNADIIKVARGAEDRERVIEANKGLRTGKDPVVETLMQATEENLSFDPNDIVGLAKRNERGLIEFRELTRMKNEKGEMVERPTWHSYEIANRFLEEAMESVEPNARPLWLRAASAQRRIEQAGTTLHPDFVIRNLMRDVISVAITSPPGEAPAFRAGLREIFKGDGSQAMNDARGVGGVGLGRGTSELPKLKGLGKNLYPDSILGASWRNPGHLMVYGFRRYAALARKAEQASRISVNQKLLSKGVSITLAAGESRDRATNFAQRPPPGAFDVAFSVVPWLGSFSKGFEGISRALVGSAPISGMVSDTTRGQRLAKTYAAVGVMTGLLVANDLDNRDNVLDQARSEIDRLRYANRYIDRFPHLPPPKSYTEAILNRRYITVRIPLPFEFGYIANAGSRIIQKVAFDLPVKTQELLGSAISETLPSGAGAFGKVINLARNKTQLGSPIVPEREKVGGGYVDPSIQTGRNQLITDLFRKLDQDTIHPRQVEFLWYSLTGTLGRDVIQFADYAYKASTGRGVLTPPVSRYFSLSFGADIVKNTDELIRRARRESQKANKFLAAVGKGYHALDDEGKADLAENLRWLVVDDSLSALSELYAADAVFRADNSAFRKERITLLMRAEKAKGNPITDYAARRQVQREYAVESKKIQLAIGEVKDSLAELVRKLDLEAEF